MPLTGSFDCLDVDELLGLLARRRATGRLHLRAGAAHGALLLHDGRVADAHATGNDGANVVIDWRERAEELCCRALRAARGGFEFVPDDVTPPSGSPIDVHDLLRRARQRAEAWEAIEAVIPSSDAVPRLDETLAAEDVTLDRDQWAVLVAIDGRRTIAGLARRLDLGLLRCCQLLLPLVESGAVELVREPELVAPRLPPPPAEPGDLGEEVAASEPTPAAEPARSEAPGHDDAHAASAIVRIRRRTAAPAPLA